MHVSRLGLTPVKGMFHGALTDLELTRAGPRDDRVFCLVEPATGRILRTVENDALLACEARWSPPVLTVRTPLGSASGVVTDGEPLAGDYWGREVRLAAIGGPWSALLSDYLGRSVAMCKAVVPGSVVWAGAVSIVTTSSLEELAGRTGGRYDDGARFRSTIVVDSGDAPAFVEDSWVGSRIQIGHAVVTVTERLPRCAVVDRPPAGGGADLRVLAALARDRQYGKEIYFGVTGEVARPAFVSVNDPVRVVSGSAG